MTLAALASHVTVSCQPWVGHGARQERLERCLWSSGQSNPTGDSWCAIPPQYFDGEQASKVDTASYIETRSRVHRGNTTVGDHGHVSVDAGHWHIERRGYEEATGQGTAVGAHWT